MSTPQAPQSVPLTVPAGVPLRLYLTRKVSKRAGAPVEATLLEPMYGFDHQVLPAGTKVLGRVSRVEPVRRSTRLRAVLGGDLTPLHVAHYRVHLAGAAGWAGDAASDRRKPAA